MKARYALSAYVEAICAHYDAIEYMYCLFDWLLQNILLIDKISFKQSERIRGYREQFEFCKLSIYFDFVQSIKNNNNNNNKKICKVNKTFIELRSVLLSSRTDTITNFMHYALSVWICIFSKQYLTLFFISKRLATASISLIIDWSSQKNFTVRFVLLYVSLLFCKFWLLLF